ncbi:MAG: FUSC family protein [Fimbriimonas sp.]
MPVLDSILRFDRSGWRPGPAGIRFLGVALAVLMPTLLGQHGAAVLVGMGALYAGMASFGGVHPARLRRMVATSLSAALLTLVGIAVGASDAATVVAVTLGAFAFSILAAVSPGASLVALQATGVLIVLSGLPIGNAHPWATAGMVLAGGLIQTALIVAFAPVAPRAAERRAVADAYVALAAYVEALADEDARVLPDPAPFQEARAQLDEAVRFGPHPEHARLAHALQVGESLRAVLVGFARVFREGERPEALQANLAHVLRTIEAGLRRGEVEAPVLAGNPEAPELREWWTRVRDVLTALEDAPPAIEANGGRWRAWLPASLKWPDAGTLRQLAFGHALRYAFALGAATLAYRMAHSPHGYWIPLTVAFVLRPDYASTLTRGFSRVVGTLAGVLVATGIVHLFHPAPVLLTLSMLVAVWLAFAVFRANLTAFTAILTVYIVFSVAAAGVVDPALGWQRLVATAVGVVVALAAAVVWPTWEARKVRDVLREAAEAQAIYGETVAARLRGETSAEEVQVAHAAARRLGLEAQRVIDAAGLEPRWGRAGHLDEAPETLERLHENAARLLTASVRGEREAIAPIVEDAKKRAAYLA